MDERGGPKDVGRLFGRLRERPTPELDSQRLWCRIEARLEAREARWWRRLAGAPAASGRRVVGAALAALAAIAIVAVGVRMIGAPRPAGSTQIVWLEPEGPRVGGDETATGAPAQGATAGAVVGSGEAAGGEPPPPRVHLDVRLAQAFDGEAPTGLDTATSAAAGGADPFVDVRADLLSLLQSDGVGMAGRWEGELTPGRPAVGLAGYELRFESARRHDDGSVELRGVRLEGGGRSLTASSLRLRPGRPLLLGVPAAADESPTLVLVVRLTETGGEPAPGSGQEPDGAADRR